MLDDPWLLLAGLLAVGGLLGTVLPLLPGTPLIFLAALAYDSGHEWQIFGPLWLGILLALMLLGMSADWAFGSLGARRGGASWLALVVGFLAGFVGLLVFSLPGMLVGSIGGVVVIELVRRRHAGQAVRAGSGWLIGWFLSAVVEFAIGFVMIALMIWRIG
ncbi:MAG: DUF456 domain-containing protein [Ardenticatenaceae bacterium]|nr:DUF456 domain-containing protein [Ardenticatenaceae bacterium]HBY95644.1 DUF456 domain-containing protein [Chloroflexota bacterium]